MKEPDFAIRNGLDAGIGDGHTMRVTAKVFQHGLGRGEGPLGVHDPLLAFKGAAELVPPMGGGQGLGSTEELKLVLAAGGIEQIEEFGAKNDAEGMNVKQEVGSCRNPARAVEGKRAAWDQTVQVKVIQQGLIPGVENGEETDLAFQMGSSEIGKSFRHRLEEDVEENLLVGEDQRIQFMRKSKDQMEVADRKKLRFLGLDPFISGRRTTPGTMPVPARVEKGAFKAAGIAPLQMTAQRFSAAHFNRMHDFAVSGRQRITAPIVGPVKAEHIAGSHRVRESAAARSGAACMDWR